MPNLELLFQWISIGQKVVEAGLPLWNDIKGVLAAHGIEADTSALDNVIADAQARKAAAEAETQADA